MRSWRSLKTSSNGRRIHLCASATTAHHRITEACRHHDVAYRESHRHDCGDPRRTTRRRPHSDRSRDALRRMRHHPVRNARRSVYELRHLHGRTARGPQSAERRSSSKRQVSMPTLMSIGVLVFSAPAFIMRCSTSAAISRGETPGASRSPQPVGFRSSVLPAEPFTGLP